MTVESFGRATTAAANTPADTRPMTGNHQTNERTGTETTITNYLIIDWKNESTRTRKSEPSASDLGTHEIATDIELQVVIPDVDVDSLRARVEVPQPRVEASELADADADDAPDWMDVADEILDENPDADYLSDRDKLAVDVLQSAPGRPDVADVLKYIKQSMNERRRERDGGDSA